MSRESGLAVRLDLTTLPALPEGWCWCVASDICRVIASGSTPTADKMSSGSGEIPFLKVYNLTHDGSLNFSLNPTFVSRHTHENKLSRSRTHPGDVLINIVGPPLGKVSLVPSDYPEWNINQAIVLFRPESTLQSKYLCHALLNKEVMDRITSLSKATAGQHNIGVNMCRSLLPIPVAPENEQRRIIEKVEELLSDLDAGVAALVRGRSKLRQYRASALKEAVEGGLTADWRSTHPDVEPATDLLKRILDERRLRWEEGQLARYAETGKVPPKNWRDKYPEPAMPQSSGLHELPPGWCWTTLDAIADLTGGLTKGQQRPGRDHLRVVPYLRVANVQRGFLDLEEIKTIEATEDEIDFLKLRQGDILFNEGGDRDKLGRGWVWRDEIPECIHQNHVFRARLIDRTMLPELISHHGNTFGQAWFMRTGKQSVNLASINLTVLKQFPVPLAPVEEQKQIQLEIEQRLSIVDQALLQVDVNLRRSARLRQSILKRAFEGRLVPQDPDDEPAERLLERIREERGQTHENGTAPRKSKSPRRTHSRSFNPLLDLKPNVEGSGGDE